MRTVEMDFLHGGGPPPLGVAQIVNLLFRRVANLRRAARRLPIGDTADNLSALHRLRRDVASENAELPAARGIFNLRA